jgi:hypothetical protein
MINAWFVQFVASVQAMDLYVFHLEDQTETWVRFAVVDLEILVAQNVVLAEHVPEKTELWFLGLRYLLPYQQKITRPMKYFLYRIHLVR